jgi:hypothetical protein
MILIVIVGWENTAIMISGWPLDGEGLNPWQGPTEGIFFALVSFVSSWNNFPIISRHISSEHRFRWNIDIFGFVLSH